MSIKRKTVTIIMALFLVACILTGCREADIVSLNLSQEADNFNVSRQITVFNTRTDTVLFQMTGLMSLKNEDADELSVICETSDGVYKKHFIYLSPDTTYIVEDVTGANVDKYRYELNILPKMFIPVKPTFND